MLRGPVTKPMMLQMLMNAKRVSGQNWFPAKIRTKYCRIPKRNQAFLSFGLAATTQIPSSRQARRKKNVKKEYPADQLQRARACGVERSQADGNSVRRFSLRLKGHLHRVAGMGLAQLFEKHVIAGERTAVDGYHRVSPVNAGFPGLLAHAGGGAKSKSREKWDCAARESS